MTVEATIACSTVSACSGCQAGRSSIVRRTPARIPASGSSSSTGASEPFATTAPESSRRAERVGALEPVAPEALGEIAVGRRVAELHRAGDAELGEPRDVRRVEALRVLDPVAEAERLPRVLRRLEGVERVAVGPVADRVHGDRPAGRCGRARTISSSSSRLVISTPEPSSISAVREPSVPSMNAFR